MQMADKVLHVCVKVFRTLYLVRHMYVMKWMSLLTRKENQKEKPQDGAFLNLSRDFIHL